MSMRVTSSRRVALSAIAVVVVAAGCQQPADRPEGAAPSPRAPGPVSPAPEQRGITKPRGVLVENAGQPGTKTIIRRAMADLKKVGLWRPLTKHLYGVKFATRPGRHSIPDDGHLADAFLTARIDGDEGGTYCDIMFFPAAMEDDLTRWRGYHARGLLPEPAPTDRQFWASIMAHELAHCLREKRGEEEAGRWEQRALEAVREAGLE